MGIEIVKEVYSLTVQFPGDEKYSLISQIRRSAVSIPSNIAEGFKRFYNKEFRQFLYIALGSAAELETLLIISNELSYINTDTLNQINEKLDHLNKMINKLIQKLND
jgi:four helix bundle protein